MGWLPILTHMFTPAVHNGLKGFPDLLVPPQPLRLLLLQHLSPSKHVEYFRCFSANLPPRAVDGTKPLGMSFRMLEKSHARRKQ